MPVDTKESGGAITQFPVQTCLSDCVELVGFTEGV